MNAIPPKPFACEAAAPFLGSTTAHGPACRPRMRRAYCEPAMAPLAEPSDETLMLQYRDGDAGAFETLYRRHKGGLYRYLLRQCRDPAGAAGSASGVGKGSVYGTVPSGVAGAAGSAIRSGTDFGLSMAAPGWRF